MRHTLQIIALVLGCTLSLGAQAPAPGGRPGGPPPSPTAADGVAYHVAYVEALPAAREGAASALRAYRDAARREPGAARIDVFQQVGRATHFVVVETWSNLESRDAHATAPSTRTLRESMARLGASGYDERPYKTLSVAPARVGGAQAVHLVSHVDTVPTPGADGPGLLRRIADASRAEAGNLRYDVLQHAVRANHFTVVESWANQAAADAHASAAHTRQYRLDVQPMTGSPLDERMFKALD